jgi:hypothetical protein
MVGFTSSVPPSPRELFCLQLQQDLKEKRITIDPSTNQAKELVALMLQSKLGDFSERDHTPGYSKSHFNFLFDNENDIVSWECNQ